jgi:non-specific serine/threonine protein kinase/serine/threonine-protein kinase
MSPPLPPEEPGYWNEVAEIFAAALPAAALERAAILDVRCGTRPDLRADVESMLAADAGAGGFLTPRTLIPPGDLVDDRPAAPLRPGTRVGAFGLLERIAQGGMGEVYRAERVDGGFAQQVAIKLVAGRLIGAGTVRRFLAERQILASLQHPSIVSVVDGGLTADGQPYLAMELVAGVPITQHCTTQALSLDARLQLFTQLCVAVAFAHRHLVVHRDLKPGNVLVTADGHVKVLDFGIAKLLEPAPALPSATVALPGPLTPDYTSPEQIRGLPVTTASDVYALGVMLYELLAGVRPYETSGRTVDELLALVVDREPTRPSTAARAAVDRRRLRGDLDAIVLKAMAKQPDRRYDSAQSFADDIRHFLNGRPVQAREPSLAYLARKAFARHRAAFTVGSVCLVLLVAALVAALSQMRDAEIERARAEQRFQDVRQLANYVIYDLQDGIATLAGATALRGDMVRKSLQYLDLLAAEAGRDIPLLLEIAGAYHRLGDVLGNPGVANLGNRDGPAASYGKARALYDRVLTIDPGHRPTLRALAGLLVTESDFYGIVGQQERASEAHLRSRAIWESLVQSDPYEDANLQGLASTEVTSYLRAGGPQSDAALPHLQRALTIFQQLSDARPLDFDRLRRVALCHRYLVTFCLRRQQNEDAMEHARQAAAIDERRLAANPHDAAAKQDYSTDLGQMAVSARRLERPRKALDLYRQSLTLRRQLWEADRANVFARDRLMYTLKEVGALYVDLAQWDAARTHLLEAVEHASALHEKVPGSVPVEMLIQSYFHLGRLERGLDRTPCEWFRRSVAAAPAGEEAMDSFQYRAAVKGALDGAREALKSCP